MPLIIIVQCYAWVHDLSWQSVKHCKSKHTLDRCNERIKYLQEEDLTILNAIAKPCVVFILAISRKLVILWSAGSM